MPRSEMARPAREILRGTLRPKDPSLPQQLRLFNSLQDLRFACYLDMTPCNDAVGSGCTSLIGLYTAEVGDAAIGIAFSPSLTASEQCYGEFPDLPITALVAEAAFMPPRST